MKEWVGKWQCWGFPANAAANWLPQKMLLFLLMKHGDTCPLTSKSANKGNILLGCMRWNKKPMWFVLTAKGIFFSRDKFNGGKMKKKPTMLWCLWVTWSQTEGQQRESRAETPHGVTSHRFTSATNWRIREGEKKPQSHKKVKADPYFDKQATQFANIPGSCTLCVTPQ